MPSPSPQSPAAQPCDEPQMMMVGERCIAFLRRVAAPDVSAPGLVWLPGFRSDMRSTKACALNVWAASQGRALLRLDYSGHGMSSGRFEDGTIGLWLAEALAVFRAQTLGPQLIIGSSMGGWLALLLARALAEAGEKERLHALVLIAPAVDFTQALLFPRLPPAARMQIETQGVWLRPSGYGDDMPITRTLIEEGRNHLLFGTLLRSHCPVHILQGMKDPDVPWQHAMQLVEHLASDPVVITLVKDGDHRLSREEDVARLLAAVAGL